MYWGIDGCKGGWIAIGLGNEASYQAVYAKSIKQFWTNHGDTAKCILIDMPIGLASDSERRLTEQSARNILKQRRSSVFSVPTRAAIEYGGQHDFDSEYYQAACSINRKIEGKAFSKQSWNISAKIHEVDQFLRDHPNTQNHVLESHPEVLFWALNNHEPMPYSKKTGLGFLDRVQILENHQANALDIIRETYAQYQRVLLDDDIVDALVCAICAKIGNFSTLPEHPKKDAYSIPMQMVYPKQ